GVGYVVNTTVSSSGIGYYFTRSDCNLKNMFYQRIGGHNMIHIISFFSLLTVLVLVLPARGEKTGGKKGGDEPLQGEFITILTGGSRSEERRVGKECRSK